MKKVSIFIFTILIVISCFTGCKSKAERKLENAKSGVKSAQNAADRARNNYNDLNDGLSHLDDLYKKTK